MRVSTKLGLVVALVALLTVLLAAEASAHEQIDPSSFPVGKPTFLTLRAANEEQSDLTKIVLTAPKNLPFGEATQEPAGWSVNRSEEAITYTGGAVKPEAFAEWGFEIEGADQPGTYEYTVAMTFADGKTEDAKVAVTAAAAAEAGASKSSSSAGASKSSVDAAKSRANAALAVGIVAILLGIVAVVLIVSRRRGKASGAPAAGGDAKQDW